MAISKINSRSIQDGTVVGADITPGTVTNAKISPSAAIANAKLANSSISINGSSVSLGGSATINTAIDWQAVTVADGSTTVNCTAGKGYFLDTNAGVIEAFLPTSPTRGDRVVLADYSGTFATNQAIVNTGGELLDSTAGNDFKLTTNNTIAEFIYVDSAKGWLVYLNQAAGTTPSSAFGVLGDYDSNPANYPFITATGGTVTESGDYKIHTFTGDGCFSVTWAGSSPAPSTVDYLVVAGGGGGCKYRSGGGGAGGYRESHSTCVSGCYTASPLATPTGITVTATTYPITVGGGGSGGVAPSTPGTSGSNSIFSTITSTGGGRGAGGGGAGDTGGSGGGGAAPSGPGGSGNTPPVSPPQGSNGGSAGAGGPNWGAGGGGGAVAVGSNGSPGGGGPGGAGTTSSINGTPTARGGGGAGGGIFSAPSTTGGTGGGGDSPSNSPGTAGSSNTGGGGGGANSTSDGTQNNGGAGGKGIVIIRYKFQ